MRARALGYLRGGRTGLPRRLRRGAGAAIATSRRANKGDGLGGGRRGTLPRRRRGDEGAALRSRAVPAGRAGGTTDARPHRLQQTRPVMLHRVYTARGTTTAAKTALHKERTASLMFAARGTQPSPCLTMVCSRMCQQASLLSHRQPMVTPISANWRL